MTIAKGSISCRRFTVSNELPASFNHTATMALRRYAFRPIDGDRGEHQSLGWVNPQRLLDDAIVYDDCVDGNLVKLAVRQDVKKIAKPLFLARRAQLHEKVKREKGIERLTRQHRIALDEQLTLEMLKETTPRTTVIEVVWDRNTGDLFIGSTGKSTCERIVDLFASTFDVRPSPWMPALMAYGVCAEQGLEEVFGGEAKVVPISREAGGGCATSLPVLEILERYGSVGPDFLTWLCSYAVNGATFSPACEPGLLVGVVGALCMKGEAGECVEASLKGDGAGHSAEWETALSQGKRVAKAALVFTAQDNTWSFALNGETFAVSAMKPPVPKIPDADEYLSLRVQATQHLVRILADLFDDFLRVRLDAAKWKAIVEQWSEGGAMTLGGGDAA